jgi:gamma-glutamylcyclotransferase (GGCT)/AIG2-like uncharacterized protein YtfP
MDLLFVYGTLIENKKTKIHKLLNKNSLYISKAVFQGKLYDTGKYPAAIKSNKKNDIVIGNIIKILDLEILKKIDEYEGLEYKRNITTLVANKKNIKAWIYLYCKSIEKHKRIISGNWLKYKKLD